MMTLRNVGWHPIRAAFTAFGLSLSTGILVVSLFTRDTMELLIDVTYFMADRQDTTVSFVEKRPLNVVYQMARLPGVLAAEPLREVPVRIRHGAVERRIMLGGRPRNADLSRVIDVDLRPVVPPETRLAISDMLARILGVHAGDFVEVDLLEGRRRTVTLPVAALVEDYFGIKAMMDADALSKVIRELPSSRKGCPAAWNADHRKIIFSCSRP
jgi:putative ABC transport system permease protein